MTLVHRSMTEGAGKAIVITADTNLETWADSFPTSGAHNINLTSAQGSIPAGDWYIELVRDSGDTSGNIYHLRATSSTGDANIVYLNTAIAWV